MGEALAKLARIRKQQQGGDDKGGEQKLSDQEQRALDKMQTEAEQAGATLATEGKGGLPPSLVLGVMRRDKYRCKRCGSSENLTIHHKGHLENPKSKWLRKIGSSNDPNNLVTLCAGPRKDGSPGCHDDIHEEDRDNGEDQKR